MKHNSILSEGQVVKLYMLISIYLLSVSLYFIYQGRNLGNQYNVLNILPIFYALGLMVIGFMNVNVVTNIFKIAILALYGLRMYVNTFLIVLNGGYEFNTMRTWIQENLDKSVMLQCYEFLCVCLFLVILKAPNSKRVVAYFDITMDFKRTKYIRRVILILTLISIMVILQYPMLLDQFSPVIMSSDEAELQWLIKNAAIKDQVPTLVYYIFSWMIALVKIVLVYLVIVYIKKKTNKKQRDLLGIGFSIIAVSTLILITTSDKASSIYAALAMILTLMKIYPRKKKLLINMGIFSLLFIVFGIFIGGALVQEECIENLTFQFNLYFSGSTNIAAALVMPEVDKLTYLKGDILRSIPLINGFFTYLPKSYLLFNRTLGIDFIYNSQILPCIGQGYFYLGYLGAPILSLMLIGGSLTAYKKALYAKDSFGYFLYTYSAIFLCVGTVMYDFFLTLSLIMEYCVPLWIMYKLFLHRLR